MMELKEKVDLINNNLLKMFELTISYLNNAFSYYKDENNTDEEKINDDIVDKLERQVEEDCLLVILKERPFASDLRKVTGIFKLVEDIERLGEDLEIMQKILPGLVKIYIKLKKHIAQKRLQKLLKLLFLWSQILINL